MAAGKNHLLAGWLAETGITKPVLAAAIRGGLSAGVRPRGVRVAADDRALD
jgi:hypothetical protein